jgi:hypothetical protein
MLLISELPVAPSGRSLAHCFAPDDQGRSSNSANPLFFPGLNRSSRPVALADCVCWTQGGMHEVEIVSLGLQIPMLGSIR